ncbi:usherin-like isoform X3 [Clavelina lepadiformis]|uniref:usherin-like isoform X3 n=1 Tax=Clavelina lepadiformis TaxID=159417 RepID=UPI0040412829
MLRSVLPHLLLLASFTAPSSSQQERQKAGARVPVFHNIAKFKPVSTIIEANTCGFYSQTDFCAAAETADGINDGACSREICNQKCPHRDKKNDPSPNFLNMLEIAQGGRCVMPDNLDLPPRKTGQSFRFINDPECGVNPPKVPRMGRDKNGLGQFTLALWIKQEPNNAGIMLEKIAGPGRNKQVVITLLLSAFSTMMQYLGADGRIHLKVIRNAPIPSNTWTHFALQVYKDDVSVFLDGVGPDGTATAVEKLEIPTIDDNRQPLIRIGQRIRRTPQFVGRMFDYRWYDRALTNREIDELAKGAFPAVKIQSNCLCPPGFPKVHPTKPRFCIPNGASDVDTESMQLRLHPNAHPLAFVNDGDESTSWISKSGVYMPGGVTITIDLDNGEYEIFHVVMHFYNSQPGGITISRRSNGTDGEMEIWGYFADDCDLRFKYPDNGRLRTSDAVNCERFDEPVPYSNNIVTFKLLQGKVPRRGENDFFNTPKLMEFVKATQVQIRFQFQYYTSPADVSTKHQYYGVKEIQIVGRCNCHGHAISCDTSRNPYQCDCLRESHTEGSMCQQCQPLFNNKAFRIGDTKDEYNCQPCECHQHADRCHYERDVDPFPDDFYRGGGGVCDDCKHHTTGRHCEVCVELYFREASKDLAAPEVCTACRCHPGGVFNATMDCEKVGGQCSCKEKVTGRRCHQCINGFYNLDRYNEQGCEDCGCHLAGTVNRTFTCTMRRGQCKCRENVRGRKCSECEFGFKNLTDSNPQGCEPCNCNDTGSIDQNCNPGNGQCFCRQHVQGLFCDDCADGYWGLSGDGCHPCACDLAGSEPGTICDKVTGQCVCKANTQGRKCDECVDAFYSLKSTNKQGCESCNCDPRGTSNGSLICDKISGQCNCKPNVGGKICNVCRGNTFGLRADLELGCEACNCDPMGTLHGQEMAPHELICDPNSGQCVCLSSREGRRCDQCSPGFYLPPSNETGCLLCDCHPVGSTSQTCNNVTGKCRCKPAETGAGLTGRRCDECDKTFWDFHPLFGTCQSCGCEVAGSEHGECNVITGQCPCKGNVVGKHCDTCRPGSSHLNSENPMGCYSHPEQQASPTEKNVTSRWISLTWNPPDLPNGDTLTFRLFRNKEMIHDLNDSSPFRTYFYNDTGLLPYTNYDYYIETSNVGGTAISPTLRVQTLAGIPTGVPPLKVSNIRAHKATFSWREPEVAHGPIETYVLQSVTFEADDVYEVHYRGLSTRVVVESLRAFTNYTFTLRACTSGGCGDSFPISVITPEAKPNKQHPPVVRAVSNTSLQVWWEPPDEANGIIIQYEVMMRGIPDETGAHHPLQEVVFRSHGSYNPRPVPRPDLLAIPPPVNNFTQEGLEPFTEYEFLVSSSNSLGSVESSWARGRTLEGAPVYMPGPRLRPFSSFQMNITWRAPDPVTEARGDVKMYQVILTRNNTSGNPFAPPNEDVVIYSCGPHIQHFLASGFEPYTSHTVTMRLCNAVSCILSSASNATTLPAAPENQPSPRTERSGQLINLTWTDPEHINGPRPDFMLLRSRVAFSQPPLEMSRGVRFPGHAYVRFPPSVLPRDASYSGIQLHFRTHEPDSLLLLAASALSSGDVREEYVVLQLRDGRPWFLFDAQDNPTAVTTQKDGNRRYNDGQWHRFEANRFDGDGFIEIDGIHTGSKKSEGSTKVIGMNDGVYVGGLPTDFALARPTDRGEHVVVRQGHVGCVKDIRIQRNGALGSWTNVTWEAADRWHRAYDLWQGCPFDLDRPSSHFLGRGHLKMGQVLGALDPASWSVEFKLRTEFRSGILFFASDSDDVYMIATLRDGSIKFLISTSQTDVVEVGVDPGAVIKNASICDGEWHRVVCSFSQRKLSVEFDGMPGNVSDFAFGETTFDLNRDFYIGGVPFERLNALIAVLEDDARSFGGCMRDFAINGRNVDFIRDSVFALNVDLDGCPKGAHNSPQYPGAASGDGSGDTLEYPSESYHSPLLLRNNGSCQENPIDVLYDGKKRGYLDRKLEDDIFTRFLFKVVSSNAGGEAQSDWMVARSGEGVPHTVPGPFNERSVSGREVELEWRRPINANGVIVNYTLSALPLARADDMNSTWYNTSNTINVTFIGDHHIGNISGLRPWTNYSITITACTISGCASSPGSTMVATQQEIPSGVRAPTAVVDAHNMTIHWTEPEAPNGPLTRYTLYHNQSRVYSGLETHFTIQGLPVFTRQLFSLEACTSVGCNASQEVTLYSGQLPPGHVDQPMVTVRGPHTVEIRWLEPAIMNGILERYVLYLRDASVDNEGLGDVVHNTTDRVLLHTLYDLIAGTDYYITLSACTGGGCKLSSPTPCRTIESVPDGIPPPDVTSTDPHSFDISWSKPELPNGVITLYSLYQNDILTHNSSGPSSTQVDGLTPWSRHSFRVRVCTKKGCSFGPTVVKRTQESPPEGSVKLSVTVLGPRTLEARWGKPVRENGRIHYKLICDGLFYRSPDDMDYTTNKEPRVVLNSTDAEKWMRVESLIPYSDYIVKVNASNSAGYVISSMRTVAMPPGAPDGVIEPILTSQSSDSILASWSDPARNNAPGDAYFQLKYRSLFPPQVERDAFTSRTRQMTFNLTGLSPYKEYEFQLIASNAHGETSSVWASIHTQMSVPSSLDPPIIYANDAWSMYVTWENPSEPNGVIRSYNLYQNDVLRTELPGNVTNFLADNLTPFTTYWFRIEACTSAGCTKSDPSRPVTTSASAPEGVHSPVLRSDTPASVFVTWSAPDVTNGILDNYRLERRSNKSDDGDLSDSEVLGVFVPSQSLRYLDESEQLRPYSAYQYRVISTTLAGGSTTSQWATVRTRPGRPGGIAAPLVTISGSESALVEWETPEQENGPITGYEISFPEPRIRIDDVTIRERNVTGLIPYTDYEVTITACTTGGCTQSPSASVRTDPDVPWGLDPPIATPITERYVNIQWKPPAYKNGPGIYYELSRTIVSQPLLPVPPPYINLTETIYTGEGLAFEDRSLEKYTTCEYRLSVFNRIGSLASDVTRVTTLASYPTAPGVLQVAVHNHTAVYLWWQPPAMQQLQGEVHSYVIRYNSTNRGQGEKNFPPNVTSWKLNALQPGTFYQFELDVDNGAHTITSQPVFATTDDGAPIGVSQPVVYSLSASQLRVSWLPPWQPNGRIVAYNIIVDDVTIHTNLTEATSYVISDLRPYTIYSMKLEACTVYACAVSNSTKSTTKETFPTGVKAPLLQAVDSKRIDIKWEEPSLLNGILLNYQIQRRSVKPCANMKNSSADVIIRKPEEEKGICEYKRCERGYKICDTKCYFPIKQICCSGALHAVDSGKECCGKNYLSVRGHPRDVCCGGKFQPYQENHECCGGRYLKVKAREVCCKDPVEDRMSVGAGDSCCGGVPYFENGLQLCCGGILHDGFERKCCGGEVISSDKICCGNGVEGAPFKQDEEFLCCGLQHLPRNSTVCCQQGSKYKAHHVMDITSTVHKCCATELIASDEACCHGVGYNPSRDVCADVATLQLSDATMPQNCGTGTLCPLGRAMFSACDRCDFDRENFDCFRTKPSRDKTPTIGNDGMCPTSYVTIYRGPPTVFTFQDNDLDPFTKYQYKILAENKIGIGESESSDVTTPQAPPDEVYAPDWSSENRDTIMLSWKPPGKPNGVITRYVLLRDDLELWNGLALRHTDTNNVLSYKEYRYVLKVCTIAGCTDSPPVLATSAQGIPQFMGPPEVRVTGSRSVRLSWVRPARSNGVLQRYVINETSLGTVYVMESPDTNPQELTFTHDKLKPYTSYSYTVVACTSMGCTTSDETSVMTKEETPVGVWHRSASLPIDANSVQLFWVEPEEPNGVIIEYRLFRRIVGILNSTEQEIADTMPWNLIYTGTSDVFTYLDRLNDPGATLQYQLAALNGAGFGKSDLHLVQLPLTAPDLIPTVDVDALGPTSIQARWSFDDGVDDDDTTYVYEVVLQNDRPGMFPVAGTTTIATPLRKKRSIVGESENRLTRDRDELLTYYPAAEGTSQLIEGLTPHTVYHVRVRTCVRNENMTSQYNFSSRLNDNLSCNVGPAATARTDSAPPSGQPDPKLKATGPRSVEVTWAPPSSPNGEITGYRVYRKQSSSAESGRIAFEKMIYFTPDISTRLYADNDKELRPHTRYQYQVRVSNNKDETRSAWVDVTTQQDIPGGLDRPSVDAVSPFAVRVKWNPPNSPNGVITNYRIEYQEQTLDPTALPPIMTALTAPSTVLDATFSGLDPFTSYRVRVVAVNQALLEGRSGWTEASTFPAPPSEVANLTVSMNDGRSLLFSWEEPAVPNGEIEFYRIYKVGEDVPLFTTIVRQYFFRRLTPYTEYHLVLEACTGRELCTRSPPMSFRTAETVPEDQPPPTVNFSNATAILVSWSKPSRTNGRVISYHVIRKALSRAKSKKRDFLRRKRSLYSDDVKLFWFRDPIASSWNPESLDPWSFEDVTHHRARRQINDDDGVIIYEVIDPKYDAYNYSDSDVLPYTKYGYKIRTSSNAGHVDSDWVYTETHQAPPEGMKAPVVEQPPDKSPTSLIVRWELPERINGELQTFQVQRNSSIPLAFPPSQFQYKDRDLQPFTVYGYTVNACTAGGCVRSDVTHMRTYEEAPLYVAPPRVAALNSSAIEASWEKPEIANGVITHYRLQVDEKVRYEGMEMLVAVGDLLPHSSYAVSLKACTNSGCRQSDVTRVVTLEAPPAGLDSPELHVTSPNSIEVIWELPNRPNGDIVRYEVHRNDELVYVNDGGTTRYHDFGLAAGTEYYYVITAYNSQGQVKSEPPVSKITEPSTPSGLASPSLTATSSSSVIARWDDPVNPNGVIMNFTLYVRHVINRNKKSYEFPGNIHTFEVRGLKYFEEYLFWLMSCTDAGCVMSERALERTLEASPANQMPPRVSLPYPDQAMLSITWSPPRDANGIIRGYNLKRRRIMTSQIGSETLDEKIVANTTEHSYSDYDLSPYSQYQYQVVAINKAGEAPSPWSTAIRSGEAPPVGVPEPSFHDVQSRSAQIMAGIPRVANGIIRFYHVYMKENGTEATLLRVSTGLTKEQTVRSLQPFTTYKVRLEMCTLESLCTLGAPAYVTTLPAPPDGQEPPRVLEVNSRNLTLSWNLPQRTNGKILRYEVQLRHACPSPHQPFPQECALGAALVAYSGKGNLKVVDDLLPYTRYAFRVTSYNEYGSSESEWETAITGREEPTYVAPFKATNNISIINIRWPSSFVFNSVLERYELTDRRESIYKGFDPFHQLRRTGGEVHRFQVTAHTDTGIAKTQILVYDTTKGGSGSSILLTDEEDPPLEGPEVSLAKAPFYRTTPFILALALGVMLVIFLILAVIIKRRASALSHQRQRSPMKAPPSVGRAPIGGDSMMHPLPPYGGATSLHNHSVHSFPSKSRDMLSVGHVNRSYSAESLDRSTNNLIGADLSFDATLFSPKIGADQWERASAFDDDAVLRRPRYPGDEILTDNDVISNIFSSGDDCMIQQKNPINLVDTHL